MPERTPTGKAKIMLPTIRHNVPTIAGKIPPFVMPWSGIAVRNSQFITLIPLIAINPRMMKSTATTTKLTAPKKEKAIFCMSRFLVISIRAI